VNYRIKDWNDHFENNRTRDLKHIDWVPIPNKMDDLGYVRLVTHKHGAAHLGAWLAMVEIASRCKPRGTFPHEGADFPQALADISRLPAVVFSEVIPRLLDLQWIEEVTEIPHEGAGKPQDGAEIPQDGAPRASRVEGKGREGNTQPRVRAADLNSQISGRFEDWFMLWSGTRGNAHRSHAAQAYLSEVLLTREADAFACAESYLAGPGSDHTHGYRPDNFIFEMAKDEFKTRFTPVNGTKSIYTKDLPPDPNAHNPTWEELRAKR
jgi:hypothetical protein